MLVSARPRVFPRGLAVRIGKCVGRQSFADKALVDPVCRQSIADLLPHRPEKRSDCVSYFNAGNAPLRVPM
jgi:hypothetical protein